MLTRIAHLGVIWTTSLGLNHFRSSGYTQGERVRSAPPQGADRLVSVKDPGRQEASRLSYWSLTHLYCLLPGGNGANLSLPSPGDLPRASDPTVPALNDEAKGRPPSSFRSDIPPDAGPSVKLLDRLHLPRGRCSSFSCDCACSLC